MGILTLFFEIDEFCRRFEPAWKQHLLSGETGSRNRARTLSLSEVMTIMVLFHSSGYRTFKQFYCEFVRLYLRSEFPDLVGDTRFVEFERDALVPLAAYLQTRGGICTGISFVDSTAIAVCENLRIPRHKQFADIAGRGKTSTGWFNGFKLHARGFRLRRVAVVAHFVSSQKQLIFSPMSCGFLRRQDRLRLYHTKSSGANN